MNLFKSLFSSKKFIAMLCGLIGLVILKVFKVSVDPQTVAEVVGLAAAYILGQGIADNGKAAAQVAAISHVSLNGAVRDITEEAKDSAIEAIKSV